MFPASSARSKSRTQLTRRWLSWFIALVAVMGITCVVTMLGVAQFAGGLGHAGADAAARANAVSDVERIGFQYEQVGNAMASYNSPANGQEFQAVGDALNKALARVATLFKNDPAARKQVAAVSAQWEIFRQTTVLAARTPATGEASLEAAGLPEIADDAHVQAADLMPAAYRISIGEVGRARALERRLLIGLAVAFAASLAAAIWLGRKAARQVLQPVEHLREGAARLAAGDLGHRVFVERDDELGDLAQSFNAMADALAEHHEELSFQATHDPLTGLANRAEFNDAVEHATQPGATAAATVLFIDLDDFKVINDTDGHAAGDAVLKVAADRLRGCCRGTDLVARLGGDEFAVLMQHPMSAAEPTTMARRILGAFSTPFEVGPMKYSVAASVGVATRSADGFAGGGEELVRRADTAMYMAKGRGKGCFQVFDASMEDPLFDNAR